MREGPLKKELVGGAKRLYAHGINVRLGRPVIVLATSSIRTKITLASHL